MAGSNLSVKITADVSSLQAQFAVAQASARALASELNSLAKVAAGGVIDSTAQAKLQQVASEMLHAKDAAKQLGDQLKQSATSGHGLGGALDEIRSKISGALQFTGIAAAIEGIKELAEGIGRLTERATEMRVASSILSVTVEQFQAMGAAAEKVGTSEETFKAANEVLVRTLDEARAGAGAAIEKMLSLGVTTGQIADKTFGLTGIQQVLHARMNDTGVAASTQAALLQVLSRRLADAIPAYKALDISQQGVNKSTAETNALSTAQAEILQGIGASAKEQATWWENTADKALIYANALVRIALSSENAAVAAKNALGGADTGGGSDRIGIIQRETAAAQTSAAAQQDAARQTLETRIAAEKEALAEAVEGSSQRVAIARKLVADLTNLYGSSEVEAVRQAKEKEIEAERAYSNELSSEEERHVEAAKRAGDKRIELMQKSLDASLESLNQQDEATREFYSGQVSAQERALTTQVDAIHAAAAAHKITANQERDAVIAATNQELDAVIALLKAEQASYTEGSAEWNKLQAAQVAASQAGGKQIIAANATAATQSMALWKQAGTSIRSNFNSAVTGMLEGTQTWRQGVQSILKGVETAAIQTALTMLENWIVTSIEGTAASKATASGQIAASAAAAGAAGVASAAAIPIYGWIAAPGAGAADYSAAIAYESLVALDTGSWSVPQTMPAMLHEGEAVLPRPFAQDYRSAISGRGGDDGYGPGPSGSRGGDTHFNVGNISSLDPRSLHQVLGSPQGRRAVAAALRSHVRRGGGI